MKKTTTTKEDPFLQSYTPPDLKIAAEFLTNWLPFLAKTLCHNCTQTLSNTISSLDPDFSGELLPVKEIHCDCNGDSDTNSLGSWKDNAMGCSKYVPEALPADWVWEESEMGCSNIVDGSDTLVTDSPVGCLDHVGDTVVFGSLNSLGGSKSDNVVEAVNVGSDESLDRWKSDYVEEVHNVGYPESSGSRNRIDSAVGCSDHVADTLIFGSLGSWKSDYVPEAGDVGSPDSLGKWKSDYVPEDEDHNVGSPDSLGSWISNYVPMPRVVGSPDSSLASWKSDYVPEPVNVGFPGSPGSWKSDYVPEVVNVGSLDSLGSWKGSPKECFDNVPAVLDSDSDKSLGSWNDSAMVCSDNVPPKGTFVNSPSFLASWADMVEDEFEDDDDIGEEEENEKIVQKRNASLSKVQREYLRFKMVKRKKDFTCLRRVNGTRMNILEGLELHTGVFSATEQKCIVDFIYALEEKGRKGELQERTFSAPEKWMQGKGRVTIQFGCCYNYAVLKDGSPPGILRNKQVEPMPQLFRVMIRRLVAWHVLPPTCVPDSCIVNIYDEGDCIPPHIDHHDFLRPFCTVSFLSECNIVFGSTLKIVGPGEFSGDVAIPLPLGSVLILNGNGADVAKHCVPKVPTKRISITFRKMDESKHPDGFVPELDLQFLEPLPFERDLHSPRRDTNWVGILPTPFNDDDGLKSTRSSDFPSLQKDGQSPRAAPKSVGHSNFLSPQKDRNSFRVAPKSVNSSNFLPPQKGRESSNPVPKNVDTSDLPQHKRNRQSFRFDPKDLESESLTLQKETQSIRVSPKSVGSSDPPLHQKDRDSLGAASNFSPPQRNRQSLRIEIDSETGKRSSSHGGIRSEPPHSSIEPHISSSETRYSGKNAWYSGIGTPYSGPQARYSNTDARYSSSETRYTGSDPRYTGSDPRYSGKKKWYSGIATPYSGPHSRDSNTEATYSSSETRYTGSDPRYSSWNRPKASGGPQLRFSLGT